MVPSMPALRSKSPGSTRGAPSFPSYPDILGLVPKRCASRMPGLNCLFWHFVLYSDWFVNRILR